MAMTNADTAASPASSAVVLLEQLFPTAADGVTPWLRNFLVVIAGSLLLTLSAKLSIPFFPVPMTLQTLVVLCLGMALGPTLGATTVLFYLMQGALGLPVFAGTPEKGLGLAYMLGTTGGYLAGFVVAAFVVGLLARRHWDRSFLTTVLAMVIGNLIIYALGLVWLGTVVGWDKPIIAWGMTPFLLGDLAKVLLAAAALPTLWKWLK